MADLTQQYLNILRGYGVDTSQLQYADPAKLKRIVDQTRQAPDTGGGAMAVGQQAAQQAAKDVIGGTTPRKGLEDLLKEAHTGPDLPAPGPSMASETLLPTDQPPLQSVEDVEKRMYRPRQSRVQPAPAPEMQPGIYDPLTEGPAYEPTEDLVRKAMTGPSITPGPSMASETLLPTSPAPEMANVDEAPPYALSEMDPDKIKARQSALGETLRPSRTPMQITGRVQEDTAAMPMVDVPEDSEVPKEGLLSRLGNAVKANPDIALAGMEGIGSLLANIGAGRAQKAADQTQRQGMARSNLVSALTGGKVRPGVAEETPQMGLLGRVGQAVGTAGKLGREVSQERFERGFKEEEMGRKYDVKEAEVERKVADDVRKMMLAVGKNKLTDAQAEKYLADITRDMNAEERMMYTTKWNERAAFAGILLKQKAQTLAENQFNHLVDKDNRGLSVKEAYLELAEQDQEALQERWEKQFKLDEDALKIDNKRADAYVKSQETAAAKVLLQEKEDDRRAAAALRGVIKSDLNGDVLKGFMNAERGTFRVYNGLQAAWSDYQKEPTSANMNGIFNMYQQLFDPATVREGDLELQKRGQGVFAEVAAAIQRTGGEGFVLSQGTIDDMKSVADEFYARMLKQEAENLNGYITEFVEPDDGAALRRYYGKLWNTTIGETTTGETTTGENAGDSFVKKAFPQ
jgi:hypothetical protein